jgi:hypothetical protein
MNFKAQRRARNTLQRNLTARGGMLAARSSTAPGTALSAGGAQRMENVPWHRHLHGDTKTNGVHG